MVFSRKQESIQKDAVPFQLKRPDSPSAPTQIQAHAQPPQLPATVAPRYEASVIGSDLSIEGQSITIRCKGLLTVNGDIQADVHSRQIEVGREAQINGTVAAENVEVHGRVQGAIHGARVVLHETAEVDGDIHSQFLTIQQGASFDGRSRKVRDLAEVAPQLERPGAAPQPQRQGVAPQQPGATTPPRLPI